MGGTARGGGASEDEVGWGLPARAAGTQDDPPPNVAVPGGVLYDGWGRPVARVAAAPEPPPAHAGPPSGDPAQRRPRTVLPMWHAGNAGAVDWFVVAFGVLSAMAFLWAAVMISHVEDLEEGLGALLLFVASALLGAASNVTFLGRAVSRRRPIWLGTWIAALPGFGWLTALGAVLWNVWVS